MALVIAAVAGWFLIRGRQPHAPPAVEPILFRKFSDACHAGDAPRTYAALSAWVDALLPATPEPRLAAWLAASNDPQLAAVMRELDAALFGAESRRWTTEQAQRLAHAAAGHRRLLEGPRSDPAHSLAALNP